MLRADVLLAAFQLKHEEEEDEEEEGEGEGEESHPTVKSFV